MKMTECKNGEEGVSKREREKRERYIGERKNGEGVREREIERKIERKRERNKGEKELKGLTYQCYKPKRNLNWSLLEFFTIFSQH